MSGDSFLALMRPLTSLRIETKALRTELSEHEFAYMNVADTSGTTWDPYDLKIVAFNEVNPDNHYTISEAGVTHTVRRGKVERGLKNFDQNTTSVKLKNLSAMELNRIRTVATKSLDEFRTFDAQRPEEQEEPTQRASQPASSAGPGNAQLQEALQRRAERR